MADGSLDSKNIKVPPHSVEAELSVLGAMLIDKDSVITIAEFLKSNDFYDNRHSEIYKAMLDLYEERVPIDILTVSEKLKKQKSLKRIGGSAYLAELANSVPTAAHVEHYGRIVKNLSTKRYLLNSASRIFAIPL